MPKIIMLITGCILAGCASTGGWRALHIDGSSPERFEASVALLREELTWTRRKLFDMALADVWVTGARDAEVDDARTYVESDYLSQLDGLSYAEVIDLADESGPATLLTYTYTRGRPPLPSTPASYQPYYIPPGRAPAWASNPWAGLGEPLNYK